MNDTELAQPAVLLVEHEALIRLDLAAELEEHGFAVLEAAAPDTAILLARSHPHLVAAVVDVGRDGDTAGYDLVQAIRKDRPDVLVIIAYGRALKMPGDFDQHVVVERKPYDPAKIAVILEHGLPANVRSGAGGSRANSSDARDVEHRLAG